MAKSSRRTAVFPLIAVRMGHLLARSSAIGVGGGRARQDRQHGKGEQLHGESSVCASLGNDRQYRNLTFGEIRPIVDLSASALNSALTGLPKAVTPRDGDCHEQRLSRCHACVEGESLKTHGVCPLAGCSTPGGLGYP